MTFGSVPTGWLDCKMLGYIMFRRFGAVRLLLAWTAFLAPVEVARITFFKIALTCLS